MTQTHITTWQDIARGYRQVLEQVVNAFATTYGQEPMEKLVSMIEAIDTEADLLAVQPDASSDEDTTTGIRIARQCTQMSIAAFVAALDGEFARNEARFDSENGSTARMTATITAFLAYTSAGGTLDLGHGWKIEQENNDA